MMTERERVLAILRRQRPDQLPWMADFAYLVDSMKRSGTYPAEYTDTYLDNGLQKMHRDYGTGFYLQGFQPYRTIAHGWEIRTKTNGDILRRTLETPVGTLHEEQHYSWSSFSYGITEHMVKDIEDLKVYAWMVEHSEYVPDYEFAQKRYETIGDNGVVLCYTPKSPLMDQVAIFAGVENVTYMTMDDEEEFAALMAQMEEKYDEACRLTVESPAECIMIPENISSECVVPFYQDYMKAYHLKWTSRIREAGKFSFVHQDGTVRGLVSQLSRESGFDVIEAVTPRPVGDVDIEELEALTDPSTIIWGGILGGMFNELSCSDEEFEAHVRRVIKVMTSRPRYVLGVADQVVPGSSPRRIRRVRELVDQYGQYK